MRIGILTYHRSLNNGAFIQCYSLFKRIKKEHPTADVEVIDYTSPNIEKLYPQNLVQFFKGIVTIKDFLIRIRRLLTDPLILNRYRKKKTAFESCYGELKLSDKRFYNESLKELFQYIDTRYDLVVVGSDAIWNYSVRGFPNPYFLDTCIRIPKFCYAASCSGMNYELIPEVERNTIRDILESYYFLGVRDEDSARFLSYIGCKHSYYHTCDPTLFLNLEEMPVDETALKIKLQKYGFSFERKTIGVMGTNKMCQLVKETMGKDYQIVSLFNYCRSADVNLYDITPFEWAYVFRFFDLTVTSFFHGTLLSLKNGVPVICIAKENKYTNKHVSKVKDLLCRVEMPDVYYHMDFLSKHKDVLRQKITLLVREYLKDRIAIQLNAELRYGDSFFDAIKDVVI